jgi:adenylosuccinate lyase
MTFGMKLALWYAEIGRDIERLSRAKEIISVGKLSGAVGTFAHLDPQIEARTCDLLDLEPALVSSQIIQRDRHAEVMSAVAIAAGTLEKIAMEIRHLQRTEVREVEEPFAKGQKGSSAMPHKRNPVKSENVSGLARLIRSYSAPALGNIPLWHERDISHSSVERIIFPDAFILLDFITARMDKIIGGLLIYPEAMERNLGLMRGLVFSGKVLLELVQAGMTREAAYRAVQENAMKVWESEDTLKDLLLKDSRITEILDKGKIEKIFAGEDLMKNVDTVFKRVFSNK